MRLFPHLDIWALGEGSRSDCNSIVIDLTFALCSQRLLHPLVRLTLPHGAGSLQVGNGSMQTCLAQGGL